MASSQEIFNTLSSIINQLHFGRTQEERNILAKTLDDLNSLNYHCKIVTNYTKATLLINQCSTFIQPDDGILVQKFSQLLRHLINRQNVVIEGRTWTVTLQWCLNCLQINDKLVVVDVLLSLDALLRSNVSNIPQKSVTSQVNAVLERFKQDNKSSEVILWGCNCLEACTIPKSKELISQEDLNVCTTVFLHYLCNYNSKIDEISQSKILIVCLLGLQNIINQQPEFLKQELGLILGIIKSYMVFGLKNIGFLTPSKLMPSTLSVPELTSAVQREKKGGKLTKQRKQKASSCSKSEPNTNTDWLNDNKSNNYVPASGNNIDTNLMSRLKVSDSDFSDSEGGKIAKLNISNGRVRQAALNLFHNVIKVTEKSIIFFYWSNFIPETNSLGKHNIITCFLSDTSARGRMCALNVLLLFLTSSKQYLTQAEISGKFTSFTPFCVLLGLTLKELHNGLCLALNEVSLPVLTQALKCLAALVQCTPYHRMPYGLITKIIRNIKQFVHHKDSTIQVATLIVLGCILASEPTVVETKLALLSHDTLKTPSNVKNTSSSTVINADEFDFAEFSSSSDDDNEEPINNNNNNNMSWLLKCCINNLNNEQLIQPQIKLESLQLLCAMSRNYFDSLMVGHLKLITNSIEMTLNERNIDVKLHAGRCVDFIGQAICKYLQNNHNNSDCLQFWQTLLNGPLINLLQNEQFSILRAIGCDCLGSIGPFIFEQLSRDRQIVCITLLFACTRDAENNVKGAAVRALAICVLYPSLREDVGFVVDLCEAIYRTLNDDNLMVRIKSAWSLGNLSDALVINNNQNAFNENMDELPDSLLIKLIKACLNGASDNDKMKMNCVRALGNLMQLINEKKFYNTDLELLAVDVMNVLLKNCTCGSNMKVRWNSCYALGNVLKNPTIYRTIKPINFELIFNALMDLVVNFRNFKVRINVALALAAPTNRDYYGPYFIPLWVALFKALENTQQIDDFMEYNHRDNLVDQICLTLAHLTSLIIVEDLIKLNENLLLFMDLVKIHMNKVMDRLLPEKSTIILNALSHLRVLKANNSLNNEDKMVLDNLLQIFIVNL